MVIKFHNVLGRCFFNSIEEFKEYALDKENYRDATEAEIIKYIRESRLVGKPQFFPKAKARREKAKAAEMVQHCSLMGELELVDEWRGYYQEIHAICCSGEYPEESKWPERPKEI